MAIALDEMIHWTINLFNFKIVLHVNPSTCVQGRVLSTLLLFQSLPLLLRVGIFHSIIL